MAKVKSIFDERKLQLTSRPLEKGSKPPAFQVGFYRNNPQFTVFPNHDNGSGANMISAGMDPKTFFMLMEAIEYLASTPISDTFKVENYKPIPPEKRTDPKTKLALDSETLIGRDEDGRMWISVISISNPQAPRARFYFDVDYYHKARGKGEITGSPAFVSQIQAKGWVKMNRLFMAHVLSANGLDAQNAQAASQGGGSGGGNNWNNGGQKKQWNNGGGSGGNGGQKKQWNNGGGGNQNTGGAASGYNTSSNSDFDDGDFSDNF